MNNVVNLQKGNVVNLSKKAPGLCKVMVGLGWDPADKAEPNQQSGGFLKRLFGGAPSNPAPAATIDCDACAILLENDIMKNNSDLIYFGNLHDRYGAVVHQGDNLTGDGDGDDEEIMIDLSKMPDRINKVVIFVNIYQARSKKQNFGMIKNSFIRLVNDDTHQEICRYNISESSEYSTATAVIFGELVRNNGEWEFKALGTPSSAGSVGDVANLYR